MPKTSDVEVFKNTIYSSKIVAAAYSTSKIAETLDSSAKKMNTACTLQNFYTGHTSSLKNLPKNNIVSNYFSSRGLKSNTVFDQFNLELLRGDNPQTLNKNLKSDMNAATTSAKKTVLESASVVNSLL